MTHDEQHGQDGTARTQGTHLSAPGLRARGWTAGMVRQLLGEPDLVLAHPHFRTAQQTRLYDMRRIEAAEGSEEFKAVSAAAARRSAVARAAAQRRRREVLARIAAEPVAVPRMPPERLTAAAVAHRNRRDEERTHRRWRHVPKTATVEGTGPSTLARWKVDYLCAQLPGYGELLGSLYGSTGRAAAEDLLRRKVYAAIAEAYPDLVQECQRRVRAPQLGPSQA
ncbi:hypothetical protein [Streptomyces sp. S.PB5]|uniref:hypothetical protein n=1 Tax=Streptomyces sp. S.PB5 TaxID=3020844 RepID=UPI0025B1AE00|nr:hypothetical protein [Streptomyces sp. S.PB5]MDN3020978.1 hypothetical protein [Streptomyces sp. S.PB5]